MRNLTCIVAALSLTALAACDDDNTVPIQGFDAATDAAGGAGGQGGQGGQGGAGGEGGQGGAGGGADLALPDQAVVDMALPDMDAPDMLELDMAVDMAVPDMEPDMAIVDAEPPPPPLDAGAPCVNGEACAEEFHVCRDNVCRFDLSPQVYRMTVATVTEPSYSAPLLQGVLQTAISGGALNLLFEAGGPVEETALDTYFFVGNGRVADGAADFNAALPVQNFKGQWFQTPERSEWRVNGGSTLFKIVVPTGNVDLAGGGTGTCYVQFAPTVDVRLWPDFYEGAPVLAGRTTGYLLRADAVLVEINFNGQTLYLADFLNDSDLTIDTDGDGVADAYPFDLSIIAEPLPFTGERYNGANRNPDPEIVIHPECSGN